MSEMIASEIWGELKRYINTVDRAEAAETIIQILMDNDSDVSDIKDAFKGDDDKDYDEDYEEEDEDSDYDEDETWEN